MIRDLLKTSLTVHTVTPLHLATMKGSVQFNFGYYMVEIENYDISVLTKKY